MTKLTRRRLLSGLGLGFTGMVGVGVYAIYPSFAPAPEAVFPPPRTAADGHRQDLEFLRIMADFSRSFDPGQRAAFREAVDRLMLQTSSVDEASHEMGMARAMALADDGHTNLYGTGYGASLDVVPLRLGWFHEGLFVVKAIAPFDDLPGARVLAIDGRSLEVLAAKLRAYVGGADSLKRELAPHFMISPPALHAAGLAASPLRLRFRLELANWRVVDRDVPALAGAANGPWQDDPLMRVHRQNHWPRRDLSPVASPIDGRPWVHLLDGKRLPAYLENPDRFYWHRFFDRPDALYVQINATRDLPDQPGLKDHLSALLSEVEQQKPRNAIVDLRSNPGGNAALTADFTKRLPERLPADGRIFILTSGNTFSAGLITAARLKHFGGARSVIVGEPVGDREQFWAESQRRRLPNAGIEVGSARSFHDWEHGCSLRQIGTCYFMNFMMGVAAGKLTPRIASPLRFADYVEGHDSAIEAIVQSLAASAM